MAVTRALLEARWSSLRHHMADAGLEGLLLAGRGILASYGYVVYATGYTPLLRHSYVYLDHEAEPAFWVPSASDAAIVRERGLITDVRATGESDWAGAQLPMAHAVAAEVLARNPERIGIAGLGAIVPPSDEQVLRDALREIELVDAASVALAAKAHKDVAELAGIRSAAGLARVAYDAAPELLRPGAPAQHVVAELERVLRKAGALELLVFVDRGPHVVRRATETVLDRGDLVSVLVEVADVDGYWVELGGLFSLGRPPAASLELAAACYEALTRTVATCLPGAPVVEAAAEFDRVAASYGLRAGVGLGHGVGIDHDLPVITRGSESEFETGHVVSIHPNLLDDSAGLGAVVADGVIVGHAGDLPDRISGLELELTVLDV